MPPKMASTSRYDGKDVKAGAEGARELDRRQQRLPAGGLIVKVNG